MQHHSLLTYMLFPVIFYFYFLHTYHTFPNAKSLKSTSPLASVPLSGKCKILRKKKKLPQDMIPLNTDDRSKELSDKYSFHRFMLAIQSMFLSGYKCSAVQCIK